MAKSGKQTIKEKNPAAVALGRLGGEKKVPKGFSSLTEEELKENGRRAAQARWGTAKKRSPKKKAGK